MSRVGQQDDRRPQGREHQGRRERRSRCRVPRASCRPRCPPGIKFALSGTELTCSRRDDERQQRAFHGMARALAQNAVKGVTEGFTKDLDIVGVGYKAIVEGKKVVFTLGFSHPVEFKIPEGITIAVDKQTRVTVSGIDRQKVGQVAAEIRGLRQARSLQAEGDPLRGRDPEEEGGQGGRHGGEVGAGKPKATGKREER